MRVQLNINDRRQIIDTRDPELAALWLAQHLPDLMSANDQFSSMEIQVWPENKAEQDSIGRVVAPLNRVTLLKLAEAILKALPDD